MLISSVSDGNLLRGGLKQWLSLRRGGGVEVGEVTGGKGRGDRVEGGSKFVSTLAPTNMAQGSAASLDPNRICLARFPARTSSAALPNSSLSGERAQMHLEMGLDVISLRAM